MKILIIGIFIIIVFLFICFKKKNKKKSKKSYKFPPNIHFYKDGKIIWKVYADRKDLQETVDIAKKKYDPDGYMSFAPTGRSAFVSLRNKKRKWGGKN
jgi:hypothetical protein